MAGAPVNTQMACSECDCSTFSLLWNVEGRFLVRCGACAAETTVMATLEHDLDGAHGRVTDIRVRAVLSRLEPIGHLAPMQEPSPR
jgi:hypothetical protein